MTILMRRFAIVCLTFAIFAISLSMAVNSHPRRTANLGLGAPCPQPAGIHCSVTR